MANTDTMLAPFPHTIKVSLDQKQKKFTPRERKKKYLKKLLNEIQRTPLDNYLVLPSMPV